MSFFVRGGWVVGFLEADAKTPVGHIRTFGTADKIREVIAKTPTKMDLAAHAAVEHGIQGGRGGVWLDLTHEQYQNLKR
jgi:hypothetical protein